MILGWSILEGLGAALIVPAINTLVCANFEGSKQASANGILIGGIGIRLVVGLLPNVTFSGVTQNEASETSGLQGTSQNLGMALGTAIIGTVILSVALTSIGNSVEASPVVP
jgi:hypothetical protein